MGIKADRAVAPGKESKDNVRFVLTNIQGAPHRLYKRLYCPRGDAENRIKELKGGLQMDRTSCSRFQANFMNDLGPLVNEWQYYAGAVSASPPHPCKARPAIARKLLRLQRFPWSNLNEGPRFMNDSG